MDRALRDGYEVHRAALAHGCDVTLLPRQVMEVEDKESGVRTTFTHGLPEASKLASVTYVQDIRMRRDMVSRAGYSVPSGATYAMGGRPESPFQYAGKKLGYPVVVKPAVGDNTIDVLTGIADDQQLQSAIDYLRTPPAERPGYARAAYALTELREPGEYEGKAVVPDAYRFMIEDQVQGDYLRFVVLGGRVINAMLCPDGPWKTDAEDLQDVTDEVHSTLEEIALGAVAAVPGIELAALDLVVPDHRAATKPEAAKVVEYSERPWLAVQHAFSPELAAELADQVLAAGFDGTLRESGTTAAVEFTIDGSVHPGETLSALERTCTERGLVGEASVTDPAMGHVSGTVQGDPAEIAWLFEQLVGEGLNGQRAMLVEERQAEAFRASEFQTVREATAG